MRYRDRTIVCIRLTVFTNIASTVDDQNEFSFKTKQCYY